MNSSDISPNLGESLEDLEDDLNSDAAEEFYNFAGAILGLESDEEIMEACKNTPQVHLLTMAIRLRNSMAIEDLAAAVREASGSVGTAFYSEGEVSSGEPQAVEEESVEVSAEASE